MYNPEKNLEGVKKYFKGVSFMSTDAWLCRKVPFKGSEAIPINLFYRLNIDTKEFSVKVPANGMNNQDLRVIDLFNVKISYSYTIYFKDGKKEKIRSTKTFTDTFKIKINGDKPIKEVIYSFYLHLPYELPFQTMLSVKNY